MIEELFAGNPHQFQSTPPVRGATSVMSSAPCNASHFNPRPPCGGRLHTPRHDRRPKYFNPRPPCGGRLCAALHGAQLLQISIHAPRAGGDGDIGTSVEGMADFNPRPPCGGRLGSNSAMRSISISIHAPRAGGDFYGRRRGCDPLRISIHAPRAGGDLHHLPKSHSAAKFQSTPPVRGATIDYLGLIQSSLRFQSTPPVRGATRASGNGLP